MRYLVTLLAVGMLAGCTIVDSLKTKDYNPPVFQPWNEYINSFVGKPITLAQREFGYNYIIKELEGGRKAYHWETIRQEGHLYGNAYGVGGSSNTMICRWAFVADPAGVVRERWWRGNACPRTIRLN